MKRAGLLLTLVAIAVATSAHIGSPDVFFDGQAGPYHVNVRVFPPTVVPGIAWAYVRTTETDIDSITVRPVYWRAGVKGAPPPERAQPVEGQPGLVAQKMWLMSRGSYGVSVSVHGKRGEYSVLVPVMALASARLGLSTPLMVVLIALGVLLVAGLVAIVRAAASDSLVEPGVEPDQTVRRRGSLGAIIAVPALLIAIFGGARWWKLEDTDFQESIYRPLAARAMIATGPRAHMLRLSVSDTSGQGILSSPLMRDHGKEMHLFLVKESSMSAFAHLHPTRDEQGVFVTAIPYLPEGRYYVFGDVALESGAEYTAATMIDIPAPKVDTLSDPDDSWIADAFGVPASPGALAPLDNALSLRWDTRDTLVAGKEALLQFSVRSRSGALVPIEPYLGMTAHGVVLRDDASVFVHLHPMGTMSMASLEAFDLRNRGDTTTDGRLAAAHQMSSSATRLDGSFAFPYAFPRAGRYRMWVQVKQAGRVLTADFEVMVK